MVYPHRGTRTGAAPKQIQPAHLRFVKAQPQPRSHRAALTRRYDILGMTPEGHLRDFTSVAPATPVFEDAFAGFARGTLFMTEVGPVAIEDLMPGMMLETGRSGLQQLLWVGSMTVYPGMAGQCPEAATLTRITADSFGGMRPSQDLLLGARARLLYRHTGCREMFGTDAGFAPARAFDDGVSAFLITPASPVRVYHLALDGQQVLLANGLEVESYHPGIKADTALEPDTRETFLGLFPHVSGLEDFGLMPLPRLTAFEVDGLRGG